jgi:Lipase (class 3)
MCDLNKFIGISFNKNFNGFDGQKAHQLAVLIGSAYKQFDQQGEGGWLLPSGFTLIQELKHDKKRQVFGFVAKKEKEAFIIIRGTRTVYEWYNNTVIKYNDYWSVGGKNWGVTTKGFYLIYLDIREQIKTALPDIKDVDRIFVAGHSLGGALATLTIPDLIDSGITAAKITVYTFASPRCGDRELVNNLNNSGVKHWRIANTEDIIPTLPGATANIFSPETGKSQKEADDEANDENFIVRTYKDLKARGMKTFEHTGTPIYFTVGKNSIEDNHNLEFVYMQGIGQQPATVNKPASNLVVGS